MTDERGARAAFVCSAELVLDHGLDPADVGAAVTTGLCGHWEHEGACRWPHNNAIDAAADPAVFRTLFVATLTQEALVRGRIEEALRTSARWRVLSCGARDVDLEEQELAARLSAYDGTSAE